MTSAANCQVGLEKAAPTPSLACVNLHDAHLSGKHNFLLTIYLRYFERGEITFRNLGFKVQVEQTAPHDSLKNKFTITQLNEGLMLETTRFYSGFTAAM